MIVTIPDIDLNPTATAALVKWLSQQSTTISAPLTADITAGATTITLSVAAWQPAVPGIIGIGDELIRATAKVVNVSGTTIITGTRGIAGTTAVAHTAGDIVRELKYQSIPEAGRALMIQFFRSLLDTDDNLLAPVRAAEATRKATIAAAIT